MKTVWNRVSRAVGADTVLHAAQAARLYEQVLQEYRAATDYLAAAVDMGNAR